MRTRLIGVALAGLVLLGTAASAPAATTQTLQCIDTAAVVVRELARNANCRIDILCPTNAAVCTMQPKAFGKGIGPIEVNQYTNGTAVARCTGSGCQTPNRSFGVPPGYVYSFTAYTSGAPAAVLGEVRLEVKVITF